LALKSFYFIIGVFLFSALFLIFKEPYSSTANSLQDELSSQITFKELYAVVIEQEGIKYLLSAKEAIKKESLIEAMQVVAFKTGKKSIEEVSAKRMKMIADVVYLDGDVHYKQDEALHLQSDAISYDLEHEILSATKPFLLKAKKFTTKGSHFSYDVHNRKISADEISAKITMEK
jgi:LPS export ABC transporter protein LptC